MEHRIEGSLVPAVLPHNQRLLRPLFSHIGITAIILVTERSVEEVPDRTEGFGRRGGSGGGDGDSIPLPIPIIHPVPNVVTGTAIPATSVKPDPQRLSSHTTHQPTPTVTPRAPATTPRVTPSPWESYSVYRRCYDDYYYQAPDTDYTNYETTCDYHTCDSKQNTSVDYSPHDSE
ncbi:hypothetical protein MRX96_057546 [Rhipicephalus microplus]